MKRNISLMNIRLDKILHNKTIRNGGLFSVFSFFNRGVTFVLMTVLAKYIAPNEYGELSMFNTVVMFLGYFVGMNSSGYLGVSFFRKSRDEFRRDVTAIILMTFTFSSLILLLFIGIAPWLSEMVKVSVKFLFIGLFVSFSNIFVQLNIDYLRVQERISWYGVLTCSYALLNLILALYLVMVQCRNWHGMVYSQLTCNIIFALIAFVWFSRERIFCWPGNLCRYKKILMWSLPLIPHSVSGWMKQGLDRLIINSSHTLEDVGLFSFALMLATVIIVIGSAFNQTNSVDLYQTLSSKILSPEQKINILKRKEMWFTIAYILAAFLVLIGGVFVIPIIMPSYIASVPYFAILTLYGLAHSIYFLHCNYLFYYNSTKQLMYITFATALLHTLLSLTLTRYSLYCTCLIYVLTQTTVTLLVIWKSKKVVKENIFNEQSE